MEVKRVNSRVIYIYVGDRNKCFIKYLSFILTSILNKIKVASSRACAFFM